MFVAAAVIIGLGILALGCDDEFSSDGTTTTDTGTGGAGGSGATAGTGGSGGIGGAGGAGGEGGVGLGGAAPDRPGFNGDYYICSHSSPADCNMLDLDTKADEMHLMTGYPTNRKGLISIDPDDPFEEDKETVSASFGTGNEYFIGQSVQGFGNVYPVQSEELLNGSFIVPFEEDQENMPGIALIDTNGDSEKWLLPQIKFAQVEPILEIDLADILAGVLKQADSSYRLFVSASSKGTDSGLVLSYGTWPDGSLDQDDLKLPIFTSGQKPSTIADLGDDEIAVLNTEGPNGASIDIINALEQEPTQAIVANIPLGQNTKAVSLYELALTADKNYAVVAGGTGTQLTKLYIVNMASKSVVGSVDLWQQGTVDEIRGIAIKDNKAYVSTKDNDDIDNVVTVDFSTPTAPTIEKTIDVGYDLGAIAVHESGIIYVVASQGWWETEEDPPIHKWKRIIAFDPSLVTD